MAAEEKNEYIKHIHTFGEAVSISQINWKFIFLSVGNYSLLQVILTRCLAFCLFDVQCGSDRKLKALEKKSKRHKRYFGTLQSHC